jgi:hypothetical protein
MKNFWITWAAVFAYSMYVTVPDISSATSQVLINKGLYAAGTSFLIAIVAIGATWGIKKLIRMLSEKS